MIVDLSATVLELFVDLLTDILQKDSNYRKFSHWNTVHEAIDIGTIIRKLIDRSTFPSHSFFWQSLFQTFYSGA